MIPSGAKKTRFRRARTWLHLVARDTKRANKWEQKPQPSQAPPTYQQHSAHQQFTGEKEKKKGEIKFQIVSHVHL
eukprot:TRINITY_DN4215_c0_g1_i1.p1 TRINITY_DN4215_c0_g1~~TRINITY_DN4215_c0_g1_i1.p1  ORF type:complete len:75 (+),score=4.46 TRINITY_DN4215_c0_g1_i1:86-310(+)